MAKVILAHRVQFEVDGIQLRKRVGAIYENQRIVEDSIELFDSMRDHPDPLECAIDHALGMAARLARGQQQLT